MSEIEAQDPTLVEEEHSEEHGDVTEQEHTEETQHQEEHGEHAQPDAADVLSEEGEGHVADGDEVVEAEPKSPEPVVESAAEVTAEDAKEKAPSTPTSPSKPKVTAKPTVTTRVPAGKTAGAPGTPLVKKVIAHAARYEKHA